MCLLVNRKNRRKKSFFQPISNFIGTYRSCNKSIFMYAKIRMCISKNWFFLVINWTEQVTFVTNVSSPIFKNAYDSVFLMFKLNLTLFMGKNEKIYFLSLFKIYFSFSSRKIWKAFINRWRILFKHFHVYNLIWKNKFQ